MTRAQDAKTIYSFSDPVDFLNHAITSASSGKKRAAWSQKAWAKRLGYQSDRSLGMILKRQRSLTPKMVAAIGKSLKLDPREFRYFDLLVKRDGFHRQGVDSSLIDRELQEILSKVPARQEPVLTVDERAFAAIARWYHLPIKELIGTPGFKNSFDWIRRRLRDKVTDSQITDAFKNLLSIGAIREDSARGYVMVDEANIRKRDDIPSIAVRQHHAQMLQRAVEALNEQTLEEREYQSWTIRIDPERIGELKELLRAFAKDINSRFDDRSSERVFQLNLQLFEHTKDL